MQEFGKLLAGIMAIVAGALVIFLTAMAIYAFFGFLAWMTTDPLDFFEDGPNIWGSSDVYTEGERQWDDCVRSTKTIFDDFNDTVGATYALGDTPATESQEFMKLCLERNK